MANTQSDKTDKVSISVQVSRKTEQKLRVYGSAMGLGMGETIRKCIDDAMTPEVIEQHLEKLREDLLK